MARSEDFLGAGAVLHCYILLTDIAGSSRLTEQFPAEYFAALERHNTAVEGAVMAAGGRIFKNTGDGFLAFFESAQAALEAAVRLQLRMSAGEGDCLTVFPDGTRFSVRVALHGGMLAQIPGQEADYFGPALNRVSRICGVCHPGQMLISGHVRDAVHQLPAGLVELDLGKVRLRDLGEPEHLFQISHPQFALRQFPPVSGLDARPHNLVAQPNAFIGRDKELAELSQLLAGGARLLTVHAPGGYGKSRLAAQLCALVLWRYEHGGYLVELAPLRDVQRAPEKMAEALGFQFAGSRSPLEQLASYLHEKEILLCLDNCEHLPGIATQVAELLRACPKLRVIATSREPLRLSAEQVYHLEPLPSGPASDSVQLFADRASLVKRGFVLDALTSTGVAQICARLDGVPLSIELAAAWADSFSLPEMHEALGQHLELAARLDDLPERQRSVRASCDWSWGLLDQQQQETLMRTSVFRDGFFAEAASAVLGLEGMALRSMLSKLCDKSWLYTREVDGKARFYLRDMAALDYASGKLLDAEAHSSGTNAPGFMEGSTQPVSGRAALAHAAYYSSLAARIGPLLDGSGTHDGGLAQTQALAAWKLESANMQAALETATAAGSLDVLLPIATYIRHYLEMTSSYTQLRDCSEALIEAAERFGEELLLLGRLGLARALWRMGQANPATEEAEAALLLARQQGKPGLEASALSLLALCCDLRGDFNRALDLEGRALAIHRQAGNRRAQAVSLANLTTIYYALGQLERAVEVQSEALGYFVEIGERRGEANSLGNLATAYAALGQHERAEGLQREALAVRQELGDRRGEAISYGNLAGLARVRGDLQSSLELEQSSYAVFLAISDRYGVAHSLSNQAGIALLQGQPAGAAQLYADSLAKRVEIEDRAGVAYVCQVASSVLAAAGRYREAAIALWGGEAACSVIGYVLDPDDHVFISATLSSLADAIASGKANDDEMASWRAEACSLDSTDLAQSVLNALQCCSSSTPG